MILKQHEDFAKAVVALAREHGMDNITMKFRLGFIAQHKGDLPFRDANEYVDIAWHTERHESLGRISLQTSQYVSIDESCPPAALRPVGQEVTE